MLILASKSTTRKTLLDNAGVPVAVASAEINERAIEAQAASAGLGKLEIAIALAKAKAMAVAKTRPDAIVIGADQTLEIAGRDLHKPENRDQATDQLRFLAGKTHKLHSGVALVCGQDVLWSGAETAQLTMRDVAETELAHILDLEGDAILSSVGGYRLEGPSVRLFSRIEGDYFTILGLPLLALLDALDRFAPQTLR